MILRVLAMLLFGCLAASCGDRKELQKEKDKNLAFEKDNQGIESDNSTLKIYLGEVFAKANYIWLPLPFDRTLGEAQRACEELGFALPTSDQLQLLIEDYEQNPDRYKIPIDQYHANDRQLDETRVLCLMENT